LPLRRDLLVAREAKKPRKKVTFVAEEDSVLWEALRDCRKRLADENNVPPYVIFHDAALMQMAADKPQTPEAFLAINGVGQTKLERFGSTFMDVVRPR
jgi:ATP-dependent DNA helicase RecQ